MREGGSGRTAAPLIIHAERRVVTGVRAHTRGVLRSVRAPPRASARLRACFGQSPCRPPGPPALARSSGHSGRGSGAERSRVGVALRGSAPRPAAGNAFELQVVWDNNLKYRYTGVHEHMPVSGCHEAWGLPPRGTGGLPRGV